MIADEALAAIRTSRSEPHPMTTPRNPGVAETLAGLATNPLVHTLVQFDLGAHLTAEQRNTVCTLISTLEQQNHAEVQASAVTRQVMTAEEFRASGDLPNAADERRAANGLPPQHAAQPDTPANGTPQVSA